jgi:hypothetical protein
MRLRGSFCCTCSRVSCRCVPYTLTLTLTLSELVGEVEYAAARIFLLHVLTRLVQVCAVHPRLALAVT